MNQTIATRKEALLAKIAGYDAGLSTMTPPVAASLEEKLMLDIAKRVDDMEAVADDAVPAESTHKIDIAAGNTKVSLDPGDGASSETGGVSITANKITLQNTQNEAAVDGVNHILIEPDTPALSFQPGDDSVVDYLMHVSNMAVDAVDPNAVDAWDSESYWDINHEFMGYGANNTFDYRPVTKGDADYRYCKCIIEDYDDAPFNPNNYPSGSIVIQKEGVATIHAIYLIVYNPDDTANIGVQLTSVSA